MAGPVENPVGTVDEDHLVTALRQGLRETGTHDPGTDDTDRTQGFCHWDNFFSVGLS